VVDLDPDVVRGIDCELVYLAALELVENSVRHGRATQIHLELRHNGIPGAELVVGDNGRGIAAARRDAADDPGIGLELLRRRVVEGGGTLSVMAATPTGTRAIATFPPVD
jgi:two-component system NarL family sensor kinase